MILICLSCENDSLKNNLKENLTLYNNIQFDIQSKYYKYDSYFTIKTSDNSFILTNKIIVDSLQFGKTPMLDYFKENKDVEIVVLDKSNLYFRKEIGSSFSKIDYEILVNSINKQSKVYLLMKKYYSEIKKEKVIDNWYYFKVSKYVD